MNYLSKLSVSTQQNQQTEKHKCKRKRHIR